MFKFKALLSPKQLFRVGQTLYRFQNGSFITDLKEVAEFLRKDKAVKEELEEVKKTVLSKKEKGKK